MIGGGAPLRYDYTSRAFHALSPWNDATFAYSILQLKLGSNFISKLEVVSMLNITSQAPEMYAYNSNNRTAKYNPKVYLGTIQTISDRWLYDRQTYAGSDIKIPENWPLNVPQKGEALN